MNRPASRVAAPIAIAVGALLAGSALLARADEPGHDHAAVSRYPGAVIKDHDYKEYEEAQLILSKPVAVDGHYRADKLLPVEGHVTYLHYEIPGSASTLQVLRNYQSVLKRSGFQQLYVCERPCIDGNLSDLGALLKARDLYLNFHDQNAYLAEQRGNTYVSLALAGDGSGADAKTHAFLFVVDKAGLDDGKMAVSGDSPIAQSLARDGRVDVYGFQFDTNKAVLKPDSNATLAELATVLKDNPNLQIDVIGHTDDVGGDAANQRLSQSRAEAVALALIQRYGIAASRIGASGRGATQPVADNASEAGRARNRRVEIIARSATASTPSGAAPRPAPTAQRAAPAPQPTAQTHLDAAPPAPEANGPRETLQKANDVAQTVQTATDTLSRLKGLFGH